MIVSRHTYAVVRKLGIDVHTVFGDECFFLKDCAKATVNAGQSG